MGELVIRIRVLGIPAPQGSKSYMGVSDAGRPRFRESSKRVKPWRSDVRDAALDVIGKRSRGPRSEIVNWTPLDGPVDVTLAFRLPRPKGHMLPANSRRPEPILHPAAPPKPIGKPDLDKLTRAVLDALTGIVWRDDSQVVRLIVSKHYADDAPAGLDIWALDAIDRRLEESIP